MSSDKDIGGQVSEEQGEEESVIASPADGHDDFESDDFVEEDWDSYDDEYIEEDEGDGVAEARSSNFNKIVIGITIVVGVGVGIVRMAGSGDQGENMGLPRMEEAKAATKISEGQRVEFHGETKLDAGDDFGVAYGRDIKEQVNGEKKPEGLSGILNNPGAISKVFNREDISYEGVADQKIAPKISVNEGELMMPSPIATIRRQAEKSVGDSSLGLIPMPESTSSAGLPKAQDVALNAISDGGASEGHDYGLGDNPFQSDIKAVANRVRPVQSVSPDLIKKMDLVLDRVGAIERSFSQIEALQKSIKSLESRVAKVEKRPRKTVSTAAAPRSNRQTSSVRSSKSVAVLRGSEWVLKSARPGQAMVSKKGETDMVSISVGKTLAGIGSVTAIHMQNGQWVVQGTKGKITR